MSLCTAIAITLHLVSYHSDPFYENGNYGAGLDCQYSEYQTLSAGGYRNSYGRNSAYLTWTAETQGTWRIGVTAGLVTNYPRDGHDKTIPSGGLLLGYNAGSAVIRLFLVPKDGGVAHLMVSIPITQ